MDSASPQPGRFIDFDFNHDSGGMLAWGEDGVVFCALSDQIRQFSVAPDPGAKLTPQIVLDALNRAWESNQGLFRKVTPRVSAPFKPYALHADLTVADRARLHAIIDKHHKHYFADRPTAAQKDNLIDALGPEVAAKIVKGARDKGLIH